VSGFVPDGSDFPVVERFLASMNISKFFLVLSITILSRSIKAAPKGGFWEDRG